MVGWPQEISAEHVAPDARLFANRQQLMRSFRAQRPQTVVEIGVALGDFSVEMIEAFKPARFIALDLFDMHRYPEHWGRKSSEIFGDRTHREFYVSRVAPLITDLDVREGLSRDTAKTIADRSVDFVYIDGSHSYDDVASDASEATRMLRDGGTIVFNDYVLYDPFQKAEYGVVQAVNEMLMAGSWQVVGFALQRHMFCDIALRRR